MLDTIKNQLVQIIFIPVLMLLSVILIFDLKQIEERERQRELEL